MVGITVMIFFVGYLGFRKWMGVKRGNQNKIGINGFKFVGLACPRITNRP